METMKTDKYQQSFLNDPRFSFLFLSFEPIGYNFGKYFIFKNNFLQQPLK